MKQIFIFIICTIIIIFILFGLVTLLRIPICKGKILKPVRLWVQLFCPPNDLFKLVLDEEIDIMKIGSTKVFNFKLKYIGPYTVGVLLDKFSEDLYRKKYDLKLRIKLDFYKQNILLISKETTGDFTPFYGKRGNGFMLFEFETPENIPIDTEISCKLTVLVTDEYLNNQYGPVRLYIQKKSEE